MSHISMIMSAIFTMAMLIYIAPNIFALNRGHILRNIALWLAIFTGLGLFYMTFGPDSAHPLFNMPYAMQGMNRNEAPKILAPKPEDKKGGENPNDGTEGFTPPKE